MRLEVWLLVVALAGCASGGGSAPVAPEDGLEATPETGVIRGVVVDAAIQPVAEARVLLKSSGETLLTDAEGRFGFSRVAPGLQALEVSKPGFGPVQHLAEVVAGVAAPPVVKVLLERMPGTEPYVVPLEWTGFIECSFNVGGAFGTGCLIGEHIDDDSRVFTPIDKTPDFLQTELVWDPTQVLGENLCLRQYASQDIGGEILAPDVCGPSPLVQPVDGPRLNETRVGAGEGLERVIWVSGWLGDPSFGLAVDQAFSMFSHVFFNTQPEPGWLFVEHGAP